MSTLRVLIVDDEPVARAGLEAMLATDSGIEVTAAVGSGRAAVSAIQESAPDLVFLDVRMPDLDGFEVLEALDDPSPAVVFVTAYEEFAVRAFEVHALDYVLKPFGDRRLRKALTHAKRQITLGRAGSLAAGLAALRESGSDDRESDWATPLSREEGRADPSFIERLTVNRGGRTLVVEAARIDWIEGAGDYARLHLPGERHLLRMTLRDLERALDGRRFARIHRSIIVNMDRIREYYPISHGDYAVILEDGTRLRLSRTYRARTLAAIDGRRS